MIVQTLTMPTTAPAPTQSKSAFNTNTENRLAWEETNVTELTQWQAEANALAASMNAIASGTVASIPYTFSTTTTDSDPGAGKLRLDNATQNTATTIRADLAGSDGETWTDILNIFDDSTSTVKGYIMLQGVADGTKWIVFSVSALASPSGYKNITVAVVASSDTNPFSDSDEVLLKFTRTGDKGDTGSAGGFVQYVYSETGTTATGTTTMPFDNTIPQNTEGDQYLSLAITPTDSSNVLVIEVDIIVESSVGNSMTCALFVDSTAGALATSAHRTGQSLEPSVMTLTHHLVAGSTSARTYKIRVGGDSAGTTRINGFNSAELHGGVAASSIRITEVTP